MNAYLLNNRAFVLALSFSVLMGLSNNVPALFMSATSGNAVSGLDTQTSTQPGGGAASSFSNGSAFSGSNISLGVSASSTNFFLTVPNGGVASLSTVFSVQGNPSSVQLPLSFNFRLNGGLSGDTEPKNLGSVANAVYSSRVTATGFGIPGGTTSGSASLTCSAGGCLPLIGGDLGASTPRVRVTPVLKVEQNVFELSEEDLGALSIGATLETTLDEYATNVSVLEGTILNQIGSIGLPTRGILPGTDAEIGFNVDFGIDTHVNIPIHVTGGGLLNISIAAQASSSPLQASASADFASTFLLESITVPSDFRLVDINNLRVAFDSGLTVPVTSAVPLPGSAWLLASALLAFIRLTRHSSRRLGSARCFQNSVDGAA